MFTTSFPGALDSFTNPLAGNPLNAPSHASQHANANDAIAALEAKVGANSSAVTSSHDYKLSGVGAGDKAVSKTGTETLSAKTLTAPKINVGSDATGDIYYRDSGGLFQRLAAGAESTILNITSGLPAWIPNPAATNANSSTKGVVEIATAAEITAGTATGSTGAALAISPDQLALSAPTFNAANLTNVPIPVGSYVTAPTVSGSITTSQNVDTVFTCNFQAKAIVVYYSLQGRTGATTLVGFGTAAFAGTTLTANQHFLYNEVTGNFSGAKYVIDNQAVFAGDSSVSTNNTSVTLTVLSVTSTTFTIRLAFLCNSAAAASATFYAVATQ